MANVEPKLVACAPDQLRPHSAYVSHGLFVSASRLAALARLGEAAFIEPIVITSDFVIIDGYARVALARQQHRPSLLCLQHRVEEKDALGMVIQCHRRAEGLNDYVRIVLALEMAPSLEEAAREHQRTGGRVKGSPPLTEAERLDVRSEIAVIAGVSAGNVAKVKQLNATTVSEIRQALHSGEVSIHRAWKWSKLDSALQREALQEFKTKKGLKSKIRAIVARQKPKQPDETTTPSTISGAAVLRVLTQLCTVAHQHGTIMLAVVDVPGNNLYVTSQLYKSLNPQQELYPTCRVVDN